MSTNLAVNSEGIPPELKAIPQWVCWQLRLVNGDWTKVPIQTTGANAKVNDSSTWTDFESAYACARRRSDIEGVGFVLTEDIHIVGVDIDKCRDPLTGELTDEAREAVELLLGYWQVTPSGTGLRWFGYGRLPGQIGRGTNTLGFEVYQDARFLTVTGQALDDEVLPRIAEENANALYAFCAWRFPDKMAPKTNGHKPHDYRQHTSTLDDDEVIRRSRAAANSEKFTRLFDQGDISEYEDDDSRADLALCCMLAFWNCDALQLDRLFRQSALFREKWERIDYRELTIGKALEFTSQSYHQPGQPLSSGYSSNGTGVTASEPLPATRPMPTDCLPGPLRRLAEEANAAQGIPAEFLAVNGIAVIASVVGGAIELEIKRAFTQRPIVWLAAIGAPGTAKSPALTMATLPLDQLQNQLMADFRANVDAWEDAPKGERGPRPKLELCISSDTTMEGLAKHLADARGYLISHDELTAWIAGQYRYRGQGANERGEWLRLWSGSNVTVVRSTKDPLVLDRPTVSLAGAIQPGRLQTLAGDRPGVFADDGLFDRFLIAWPQTTVPRWSEQEIEAETLSCWFDLVMRLRQWKPAPSNRFAPSPPFATIRFTDPARRLWQRWYDSNAQSTDAAQGMTRGWASKAPSHLARVSLIFHAANNSHDLATPVESATLEAAIELIEWFRLEHGYMLASIGIGTASAPAGLAGRVERIIRENGGTANRTLLHQKTRATATELDRVRDDLIAESRISVQVADRDSGGRRAEIWTLLPPPEQSENQSYGGSDGPRFSDFLNLPEHTDSGELF